MIEDATVQNIVQIDNVQSNPSPSDNLDVNVQDVNMDTSDSKTCDAVSKSEGKSKYGQMQEGYSEEAKPDDPVDDQLATNVDFILTHHLEAKALEKLKGKYVKPSNVKYLTVPRVNPEIWDMAKNEQQQDVILQKEQEKFQAGLVPLVRALNQTNDAKTIDLLTDSLKLFAHYNMESFNMQRRYNLKPGMQKAKQLVKKETPITEQLFGDNLTEEFKRIETTIYPISSFL